VFGSKLRSLPDAPALPLVRGEMPSIPLNQPARLRPLHSDLWVCRVPYRAMGLPLGRQIVVVRLADAGLWVHSPVPMTPELRAELAALGKVRHVVGPNLWHDECLREFQAEQPDALFHAAPGLAARKRDVRFDATLSDVPHPDWETHLKQHLVRGMPGMNEVVFFHPASRSLILADLAFNLGPEGPAWFALMMRLYGAWTRFGPTRLERFLMKDKAAVRASLDRILEWDFDRVIVGHGHNVETGGKQAFREAFSFLEA
jgi:hypothetical protein